MATGPILVDDYLESGSRDCFTLLFKFVASKTENRASYRKDLAEEAAQETCEEKAGQEQFQSFCEKVIALKSQEKLTSKERNVLAIGLRFGVGVEKNLNAAGKLLPVLDLSASRWTAGKSEEFKPSLAPQRMFQAGRAQPINEQKAVRSRSNSLK